MRFNIDLSSIYKSSGYYELKPTNDFTLDQDTIETIENYRFKRDKETLSVEKKEKKEKLTAA